MSCVDAPCGFHSLPRKNYVAPTIADKTLVRAQLVWRNDAGCELCDSPGHSRARLSDQWPLSKRWQQSGPWEILFSDAGDCRGPLLFVRRSNSWCHETCPTLRHIMHFRIFHLDKVELRQKSLSLSQTSYCGNRHTTHCTYMSVTICIKTRDVLKDTHFIKLNSQIDWGQRQCRPCYWCTFYTHWYFNIFTFNICSSECPTWPQSTLTGSIWP